jgi:phosphatidylinositol alpha-1,6-mannosyltransferase
MSETIVLAAATLRAGNGGIARVARLMDRVVAEEVAAGRLEARAVCFLDSDVSDTRLPTKCTRGSRVRYVWELYTAALRRRHFLYDSLSMARAHCPLPLMRRPGLVWICGIEVWEMTNPSRLRCARHADHLLAISAYTRERANRLHGGFDRAQVCWLGTETDDAPDITPIGDCRPTALILARMDELNYKGHRELIDCWPQVIRAVGDARLLIVGGGPYLDEHRRRASASSVAESIVFTGFVPDQDIDKVWRESTVFAMPSRGEGFGLVYIEAMRHGRPVIASIHDAAPEINLDGVTGYNVNLDKPDELPQRLIYLLKNPSQAATLGLNGQRHWREHFSYSAFKKRFLPILTTFRNS